jgi:hypothetical protein
MDPATLALTAAGLLAKRPWRPHRRARRVLQPRLQADPQLTAEPARLVEEAKAQPQAAAFVTIVQDNARVGKLTNIGQVTGDLHL